MTEVSSEKRLYLALWFPFLPANRLRRTGLGTKPSAAPDERAQIFVEKESNALRIAALDARARTLGLQPGLTLADARARIPDLAVFEMDRLADRDFLLRLADASLAFTPLVAVEPPDGLVLDITGCAHLFGGEKGAILRVDAFFSTHGIDLCAALATTPDMARALARFGGSRLAIARTEARMGTLLVAALEAGEEHSRALKRAGLMTLADLAERPSDILTARFGAALTGKLARVLGREDRRIIPRRVPPPYVVDHRPAEPILSMGEVERILEVLAGKAGLLMEARGEGGRVFEAAFFRADGAVRALNVETGRPTRDPKVILKLFRERLETLADPVDPGFGFDAIRFSVAHAEKLLQPQIGLDAQEDGEREISALIDRLAARFGRERIFALLPADTHDPARADIACSVLDAPGGGAGPTGATWPAAEPGEPPARPLHLFTRPHPIDVIAEVPDGPPVRFNWRRVRHEIRLSEGPERITSPWRSRTARGPTRDYYRIEDLEGRRFWVFRAGIYGRESAAPRWFLHGLFA